MTQHMNSVADLASCASAHLEDYTDPSSTRAFASYDVVGDPDALQPVDFFAPALLQAPVSGESVRRMYLQDGAYFDLRVAMEALLADEAAATARFEDQDLAAGDGSPWSLVHAALVTSDRTPGIKASKVTKILHRKRPSLVPIFDSRVAAFYGCTPRSPSLFWPVLQADLIEHGPWLRGLVLGIHTPAPGSRELSVLRALDIIVWEHVTSGH